MKIRQKILLVFIGLASLAGIVGYLAIHTLNEIATGTNQIRKSSMLELESSTAMDYHFTIMDYLFDEYIYETIENNPIEIDIARRKLDTCFREFETALHYRKSATENGLGLYDGEELAEEKAELEEIKLLQAKYLAYKNSVLKQVAAYKSNGADSEGEHSKHQWKGNSAALVNEVTLLKKEATNEIIRATATVVDDSKASTDFLLLIAISSFLIAVVAGVFVSKSIVSPILKLKAGTDKLAMGQMELITGINARDEIGDLAVSFNKMTTDLQKAGHQIEEHTRTLEQSVFARTKELEVNIEKLRQADAQLKNYADELKKSNKELEQFAYVASHDLQEPLRTISSFVEQLQKQYYGRLDATADKYLEFVLQAADRMKVLIKDLLDYSRIGRKTELAKVDCNNTLREVLQDLGVAISEAKAEVKAAPLPVVNGYSTEIKQLFQNLVINAIKFRRQGVTPVIEISAQQRQQGWEFSVSDNGIGMDEQHNERIFIIFQRLHTRTEYEGSGIGLSHCKKIVELHGGKIWVKSKLGEGSTFYFTILDSRN